MAGLLSMVNVWGQKDSKVSKGGKKFGKTVFVKVDENDKITDAFQEDEKVLENVSDALFQVANYFYCIHIMTRVTMCGGM